MRLDSLEGRVWQLANGSTLLNVMGDQLKQPIEIILQTAFRLISVGLVAEVPMIAVSRPAGAIESLPEPVSIAAENNGRESNGQELSNSFVQNLLGFLRSSR